MEWQSHHGQSLGDVKLGVIFRSGREGGGGAKIIRIVWGGISLRGGGYVGNIDTPKSPQNTQFSS